MENASKALLMAAGVLIALMILAALILMFNNVQEFQNSGTQNQREAQVIEFNNQYETYNRKDVRGSDLYSLLNRVIDYNRRKSTEGTGSKDEGQYLAYMPMTIEYSLDNTKKDDLVYDGTFRIFKGEFANFTLNDKTSNKLEKHFNDCLKETYGTKSNMETLAKGITNIYGRTQEKDIISAIDLWNRCVKSSYRVTGGVSEYSTKIDNNQEIKDVIYTYYEYIQFKRAHFDCENVEYNNQTGRITKMEFKFNGKFN